MSVHDPSWRQKTRPCPFFSQGRCLFADSCNFLHDIRVKTTIDHLLIDAQPVKSHVFSPPKTVFNPPSVVVNSASPRSIQLSSPTDDPSRYSGLLSVLQDIIGPTAQEGEKLLSFPADTNGDFSENPPQRQPSSTSYMEASTLVEDLELCHRQDFSTVDTPRDAQETQETVTYHDIDSRDDKETWDTFPSYVVEDNDEPEEQNLDREEAQEGPTITTVLRFPSPPSRFSYMSTTSSVFSLLARPHGLVEEHLDDAGQEVSNNLLSPVSLSAGLRPFSACDYSVLPKREDSIDSGYADSWTGPTLLARTPPHAMRNSVAFDSGPVRRHSISSLQNRRVSYDVRAVRPSPRQSAVTEEHDDDTSILDAYEFPYDLDEEEAPVTRNTGLTGMMSASSSSPPDNTFEAPSWQLVSASEGDTSHAFLDADSPPAESQRSSLSSSTVRPSSAKETISTQEVVLVGLESCTLPPSPSSESAPFDTVHTDSRAEDVITPSSASSSENESDIMEGHLSSKTSALSLGAFPSGRSSPNTSIFSIECDYTYTADDTTRVNVSSRPPSPPLAQFPITSSAWICTSENGGSFTAGPRGRPKISPELLAHIGHVFSLSDEMSAPAGDVHVLDGGVDVQITDPRATWCNALNADVQQTLHMSTASPVTSSSGDAEFSPNEVDARTSLDLDLGDFSVNLRRWSGEENVPPAREDTSASSVEYDESDTLPGPSSTLERWSKELVDDMVSLPATLAPSDGQVVEQHDIDAPLIQGKQDMQMVQFHDQAPDPLDFADTPSTVTTGPMPLHHDTSLFQTPPPQTPKFVQRNRATSDVTVKPDSRSPSTPCFPPMASIPTNSPGTNSSDRSDFLQPLDDQNIVPADSQSMETSVMVPAVETRECRNVHPTSPFESIAHSQENERLSRMRVPPNLTIRIPSSSQALPPSSSAQSLPLILSLSNGHDTRRWFSSSDGDSSKADVPCASAPVTPSFSSRESGSTKVPFGFRRFNPQFAARKSLQGAQPVTPSVDTASQQLNVYSLSSPSSDRFMSPIEPQAEASTTRLIPLRLSSLLNEKSSASSPSSVTSSIFSDHIFYSSSPDSPSVSSSTSLSLNSLLPSPCSSSISEHIHNTLTPHDTRLSPFASAHAPSPQLHFRKRKSQLQPAPVPGSHNSSQHSLRRLSTLNVAYDNTEEDADEYGLTISCPVALPSRPSSVAETPVHAIAMPKPTLLFAIASDDINQVRHVLESGEAGPNDQVGPQSALAFTLTNDQLSHKNEIVKVLLAYGADPSALRNPGLNPSSEGGHKFSDSHSPPAETTPEGMDPATRYYVTRADTMHTRQTSRLIYRSFFRPLTRVRYDLIGQDWVLEQLFRVLSMHSQRLSVAPIVVLLCGPSGHGKSFLARKFGHLLDVPTHTVNMTTLRSTHNLWESYSMSPYEEPSSDTLAQFLLNNEGNRCVVVLDEIEKVEDPKALYSLLMPWELGRCSLEAGKRHVDVRSVIWLGTSNISHNLVLEYYDSRLDPSKPLTREEYRELMELSRPDVSQCLGASLLSRVTAVLPFVPFTTEEKMAIAAEAVYSLAGNVAKTLSPHDVEVIVMKVLPSYFPSEGARSLHRAVSNQLVDLI